MKENINEIPIVAQNDFLIVTFTKKMPFLSLNCIGMLVC